MRISGVQKRPPVGRLSRDYRYENEGITQGMLVDRNYGCTVRCLLCQKQGSLSQN